MLGAIYYLLGLAVMGYCLANTKEEISDARFAGVFVGALIWPFFVGAILNDYFEKKGTPDAED